jgi:hypothetical protein
VRAKALGVLYPVRKVPAASNPVPLGGYRRRPSGIRYGGVMEHSQTWIRKEGRRASAIGASRPGEGREICLKDGPSPNPLLAFGDPSLIYP